MVSSLKGMVKGIFARLGYDIVPREPGRDVYCRVTPHATYAPWNQDADFQRVHSQIVNHTLVDLYRCWELWSLVEQVAPLSGALMEVGVWRGGTGALIASRAKMCSIAEPVYLCDTFYGVVKAGERDSGYSGGEHADTSRQAVEELCAGLELANVRILEGIFPDETGDELQDNKIRFCHIDVDVYQSASDILDWVWDRLVLGGVVVYDDFGFETCDGVTRHVSEQIPKGDRLFFHNLNGHAVLVKIR